MRTVTSNPVSGSVEQGPLWCSTVTWLIGPTLLLCRCGDIEQCGSSAGLSWCPPWGHHPQAAGAAPARFSLSPAQAARDYTFLGLAQQGPAR